MIITYIYSNCLEDQGRIQLRCRNFADAINRTGVHSANLLDLDSFVRHLPEAQAMCIQSDLLVIYRYLYGPVLNAVQYWKARDKKVIVDFDQAINFMSPEMPEYSFWVEGQPLAECREGWTCIESPVDPTPLEQFKWGLGIVDAATVASSRLADDWIQFTPVYEIPDFLNTYQYPALNHVRDDEVWVGLGNCCRPASFENSGLRQAMENICRERPQVRLVLCDSHEQLAGKLDIPAAQLVTYAQHSFEEWATILLKLDIGLLPLAGDYDQRMGPINLLEYMISKIPWIASEQQAFRTLWSYGKWVQNSTEAWQSAVLAMVDQVGVYQKKAAGEPFLFALSQDISQNVDKILKVYNAIVRQTQRTGAG